MYQNRLRGSGHGIAAARMDAKLNIAGWISEQMGGLRLGFFSIFMFFSSFIFGFSDDTVIVPLLVAIQLCMCYELSLGFDIRSGNSSDGFSLS